MVGVGTVFPLGPHIIKKSIYRIDQPISLGYY
jgi:hypothetical protein